MGESMWLKCCQCGKQFEIFGELADQTRAFYAAQSGHTPDKESGVCDACWENRADKAVTPKRRWFRFSLRTLLVAVTVVCCSLAYELNWIQQRRAFLDQQTAIFDAHHFERPTADSIDYCDAPGLLWVFGERGLTSVSVWVDAGPDTPLSASDLARVAEARRLFPEADPGVQNSWDIDGVHGHWSGPVPTPP